MSSGEREEIHLKPGELLSVQRERAAGKIVAADGRVLKDMNGPISPPPAEEERPHYYGNRRYRLEVLRALAGRTKEETKIHLHTDSALIHEKELERLGLDPLSIEEMLDVDDHPEADPKVFGCTFQDAETLCLRPVICDGDFPPVNVRCNWHTDSRLTEEELAAEAADRAAGEDYLAAGPEPKHLTEQPPHPDRSINRKRKINGQSVGQMVSSYRKQEAMLGKAADFADIETLAVVAEAASRELAGHKDSGLTGFGIAIKDLQQMLQNLREGKPVETGVGE